MLKNNENNNKNKNIQKAKTKTNNILVNKKKFGPEGYFGSLSKNFFFQYSLVPEENILCDIKMEEKGLAPENISTSKLIDDEVNDLAEILNNFLVSKLKVPIYLSVNIYEPILLKDPLFISFLQEKLIEILSKK